MTRWPCLPGHSHQLFHISAVVGTHFQMEAVITDMMSRKAVLVAQGVLPSFLGTVGALLLSLFLNLSIIGIFSALLLWKRCRKFCQKTQWELVFQPWMAELCKGKVFYICLSCRYFRPLLLKSSLTVKCSVGRWGAVLSTTVTTCGVFVCVLHAVNSSAEDPEPFNLFWRFSTAVHKGSEFLEVFYINSSQCLILNFKPTWTWPECSLSVCCFSVRPSLKCNSIYSDQHVSLLHFQPWFSVPYCELTIFSRLESYTQLSLRHRYLFYDLVSMATLLYCSFKVPALVVYNEYELRSRYTGKMGLSVCLSVLSLMQFSVTSNMLKLISLQLFFFF